MKEAVTQPFLASRLYLRQQLLLVCVSLAVFGVGFLFPVLQAQAESSSVLRMGDSLTLDDEESVNGDYYGVANTVALSGEIAGDAQLLAGQVTVNGSVASDTLAVGLAVDIHGTMGDDVRIIGGEVKVASHVRGDLIVVASKLSILSTAQIDGDVIFFGGEADIAGAVEHNIMGRMTTLTIDGPVGGDISNVAVSLLTLKDKAAISGDIQYASQSELVRSPAAVVSGAIVQNAPDKTTIGSPLGVVQDIVLTLLPLLFGALCWLLVFRRNLLAVVERSRMLPLRAIIIGASVAVVLPVVAGILLVSGLGVLLGVLLLAVYVALFCVAIVALAPIIGAALHTLLLPKQPFGAFSILGGVMVVGLMLAVPFGSFLLLGGVVFSLGVITERLYTALR